MTIDYRRTGTAPSKICRIAGIALYCSFHTCFVPWILCHRPKPKPLKNWQPQLTSIINHNYPLPFDKKQQCSTTRARSSKSLRLHECLRVWVGLTTNLTLQTFGLMTFHPGWEGGAHESQTCTGSQAAMKKICKLRLRWPAKPGGCIASLLLDLVLLKQRQVRSGVFHLKSLVNTFKTLSKSDSIRSCTCPHPPPHPPATERIERLRLYILSSLRVCESTLLAALPPNCNRSSSHTKI